MAILSLILQLEHLLTRPFRRRHWAALACPALHVRIGGDPPAVGQGPGLDALEAMFARLEFRHGRYCQLWQCENVLLAETEVCRRGDPGPPAPCFLVVRVLDGRLLDVRVYLERGSC